MQYQAVQNIRTVHDLHHFSHWIRLRTPRGILCIYFDWQVCLDRFLIAMVTPIDRETFESHCWDFGLMQRYLLQKGTNGEIGFVMKGYFHAGCKHLLGV